jgi:D-tyrosyl-tRNA(Tyr) deacylase
MRAIIQRVSGASITIDGRLHASIGTGILLFVGIEDSDSAEDIKWLSSKVVSLRIFPDEGGVMNKSIIESGGEILVVSQFTLHASTKKGNSLVTSKPANQWLPFRFTSL